MEHAVVGEPTHHGPSRAVYVMIFVALLVLTGATVGAAEIDLGALNNVVMLGIAVTKATLVVLFFMHVYYGPRLVHAIVGAGLAWLAILVVFLLADYLTRGPVLGGGSF
jgi:cytochrome c oxidase subunit 4